MKHYGYKREIGDANLTINYVKALADFIINFNFGKGVQFRTPEATEAIIPFLLKRVWDEDNNRMTLLHEIGQYGTVSGDVFVKVAYEPEYQDPSGMWHQAKIRILPLNPAYCFPTWHPHDKSRLQEFKLKYKFWGIGPDGTRQINTYVEVCTEQEIREYINDEIIDIRPNPLGVIPVAYCPNYPVASSPWGLSDIQDIIPLNREYNEKATEISDIINYHAAPVTVLIGAKASNLEKGPKKVWTIPNKDASITNLQLDNNLAGPLGYLELLKQLMHEMVGVPATALGQMQPISNTSGVALAMQYQPLMQKHAQKKITYGKLFQDINTLIIRYAVMYQPEWMLYNPNVCTVPLKPSQYQACLPDDPTTYQTTTEWVSPLPLDLLLKLNEIQAKMAIGLESKRGALRELGEHFPDQKMAEIYEELLEDAKQQGAIELVTSQIQQFVVQATGIVGGQPLVVPGAEQTDAEGNPKGMAPAVDPVLAQELMARAYSPDPPSRMDWDTETS